MSNMVTSLIQAATFCIATLSLWAVYRQHRYHTLMDLHDRLLEDDVQKSLRLVFSLKPESLECPTEAELVAIERVLNLYDLIALRAKHRAIKCDDILESDWRIILPLWKKVKPFIQRQRDLRGCDSYKQFLEWLYARACAYRDAHYRGQEPTSFGPDKLLASAPSNGPGQPPLPPVTAA
jgi:hypothetical protein